MNRQRREATGTPPSLLAEFMYRPLEPEYAAAARRRARGEPVKPRRPVLMVALAILLGAVTAIAVFDLRSPSPEATAARHSLERQVREAGTDTTILERKVGRLSGEVAALRAGRPSGLSEQERSALIQEGADVGTVPVTGDGLMVTLSDSASGDPDAAVQDFDLQKVVDALWSGGAEAIAINGQRLTSLSAIRNAGSAILVNLSPVTGPYRVEAIGNADAMQVALTRTGTSDLLEVLGSQYGITSSVVPQASLSLSAAPPSSLYYAEPASVDSASSGSPTATSPRTDADIVADRRDEE